MEQCSSRRRPAVDGLEATEFSALIGSGATAKIGDRMIQVGKPELFEELGLTVRSIPDIGRLTDEGMTVILVGTEESVAGVIAIRNEKSSANLAGWLRGELLF